MDDNKVGPERLNALSDGVIAIAITLLILGIEVPSDHNFTEDGIKSFLIKLEPGLIAYVTSFIIVGLYWIMHHNIFNKIKEVNSMVILLNLLFLFLISLVPFIAKLKTFYRYDLLVIFIYGISFMITGFVLWIIWKYIIDHPELHKEKIDKNTVRRLNLYIWIIPIFTIVALTLAIINIHVGTYSFLLIPFVYLVVNRYKIT